MIARVFAGALLLVLLGGCRVDIPDIAEAGQCTFHNGTPGIASKLVPSQLDALRYWFASHNSGWHTSYITYVPGTLVSGNDRTGYPVSINLWDKLIIVNVREGQYSRSLSIQESAALHEILQKSDG
jgi:hypothetical protein